MLLADWHPAIPILWSLADRNPAIPLHWSRWQIGIQRQNVHYNQVVCFYQNATTTRLAIKALFVWYDDDRVLLLVFFFNWIRYCPAADAAATFLLERRQRQTEGTPRKGRVCNKIDASLAWYIGTQVGRCLPFSPPVLAFTLLADRDQLSRCSSLHARRFASNFANPRYRALGMLVCKKGSLVKIWTYDLDITSYAGDT